MATSGRGHNQEERNMEKNKPVWDVRLGAVRAAIFENRNADKTYFNVALTRRFKQGAEWMTSTSFNGMADLALVRQAVELAIAWLAQHEQASGASEE
jgi:hypothetical protein